MTPENFCYWLQGHYELMGERMLTDKDKIIRDHLALVFHKETPIRACVPPAPDPITPIVHKIPSMIKKGGPHNPFEERLCSTQVGQCSTESPYPVDKVASTSLLAPQTMWNSC